MKKIFLGCLFAAVAAAPAAAVQDDDINETAVVSTGPAGGDNGADDEDTAQIQESDEDLSSFVADYIGKDTALKGAFFIEDIAAKKVLKLTLVSVPKTVKDGDNHTRIVETVFKDATGKKYTVLFHIQSAGFSGVDIFKIELKTERKEEKPKKK